MITFLSELRTRNETLFYFGIICLAASIIFLVLSNISNVQVARVNAWYKPFKFAISTVTFAWAMAWYCYYLPDFNVKAFNWTVILLLGFEIIYIAMMAAQGKASHYNISTPLHSFLFSMMALAATIVTVYTAYIGYKFFTTQFPMLPDYYVWAIRIGITGFVVFSLGGFLMGRQMSHSVGLENDNSNLFILGWSKLVGDLRVSHFIGMHALQVIPVLAYYVFRNSKVTVFFGILYLAFALFTLIQALNGKPFLKEQNIKSKSTTHHEYNSNK